MLRLFQQGWLAAFLLLLPMLGMAQDCRISNVGTNFTTVGPNQPYTFTATVARTPPNTGTPCLNIDGEVTIASPNGATIQSVTTPNGTSTGPFTFRASEGQTISITVVGAPVGDNATINANCDVTVDCQDGATSQNFFLSTVVKTLQAVNGNGEAGDTGNVIQLDARALDNGVQSFSPIPVNFTVTSGPGTVSPPSGSSSMYGDATTFLTLGTATPGNDTVVVTASRGDDPTVTTTFTVTVYYYDFRTVSPAPNTAVQALQTYPLTVELLRNGVPQGGRNIFWELVQAPPGTMLEGSNIATNGEGQATNQLTVGQPNIGNPPPDLIVRASVTGIILIDGPPAKGLAGPPPLTATFTLRPTDVLGMSIASGNNQSADVGAPLTNPLVVAVTRNGSPDTVGTVNWAVNPAGAATLSSASSPTNASGNAQVNVTSVNAGGPFTVVATHADDPTATVSVTFNGTGIPPTLTLGSSTGGGQSAPVNQPIPQPLTITALSNGTPQSGVTINWTVTPAGAATFSPGTSSVTNVNGVASINVINGPTGGPYTVTATRADDPSVSFNFGLVALQRDLVKPTDSGNGQVGSINSTLPNPLVVVATVNGSPEAGVGITWSVVSGTATLTNATSPTDGAGRSSVNVTLGGTPGPVVIRATRNDDNTIVEDYTVQAFSKMLVKPTTGSGDGQSGNVGSTLPQPLVAVATLNGSPEPGVTVNWSVVSGNATLSNITNPTDNAGRSTATVTFGNTTTPVVVRATRADVPSQFQDYTLTPIAVRTLDKPATGSGNNQTGGVGTTLPQPLVAVALLNGAAESGVTVNWSVVSGNATLSNITNPTDNTGRSTATVTFGTTTTPVVVRATRADVPAEFEDYTLTPVDVRTLDKPPIGSGDGQSAQVNNELPQSLVVFARNNGQPAAGVTVTWTASNGATVTPSSTVTDATGRAEVTVRLGPTPGNVTVTATRSDAPTATASFVLTATAAPTPTPQLTLDKPLDSGDGSTFAAGEALTLTVQTLSNGVPDANVPVFWQVLSGSATIGADQTISDAGGFARTTVVAGATPGPVTVRAVHGQSGATATFTLTVSGPATSTQLAIVSGDSQNVAAGARGENLVVRLTQNGAPVSGAAVAWAVEQGTATLDSPSTTTGADGSSSNGIRFGNTAGDVFVRATANGVSTVFHLRVVDGGARVLRLVSGNNQSGPVGTRADLPILVEVVDASGTPVQGQTVDFAVLSGAATLDPQPIATDALGRASLGFRFGTTAGPVRIRASIGSSDTQTVFVNANAFLPTLAIVSGNNQTGPINTLLPQDLVVQIGTPPAGKTLAGVTVRWEVVDGGGTLASASTLTDASGRASNKFTLGPVIGTQRVRATADGGASATFTATATGTPGALTIVSGNNQTLPTRTPSAPLVVSLANTAGTPIQGATLLWAGDNAEVAAVRTTTNAQGRSTNTAEVILPGAARVTVSIEGVPNSSTVVFLLNGGVANVPTLGQPEETVAGAIDNLCPALVALANPTPAQADLRARCLELVNNAGDNPDQVDEALDQLREDVALVQANAAFVSAQAQFDNLKARIAALRSGSSGGADFSGLAIANSSGVMPLSFLPSSVVQEEDEAEGGGSMEGQDIGADFSRWGFFASGIIGRGSYDGSSVTPEYDYDTNGLTAGVDYRINDQWVAGASVGWNQQDTELTGDSGNVDADGWSISGYTTWFNQNNWYVDGVLTFGSNDYDLQRRIRYSIVGANGSTTVVDQVARASTGSDQLSMAFSFGRDFQRGALSFGPYLRGLYTRVDFDAFEEQMASGVGSGLGLEVDSRELTSMTAVVGGKLTWALSQDWGILMPHAQVEWEHEFEDDPQQLAARFLHDPTHTTIRVEGDEIDTDYFNIGLGLSALFANGRSAFLYYEHLAGSEGLSQDNLSIGVRIEF